MLHIEIVKDEESPDNHIVVNSIEDKTSHVYKNKENVVERVTLYDDDVVNELLKYSFEEVGKYLPEFTYDIEIENWDFWIDININCREKTEVVSFIQAAFNVETEEWNKPYSILSFSKELSKVVSNEWDIKCEYFQSDDDFVSNGFGIIFYSNDKQIAIRDFEEKVTNTLETILKKTTNELITGLDKEILTTFFTFPENIKTACKQYLIYFTQFLLDLGIDADTEIKEEANNTLFKIIPKDKSESLEKIKEALTAYLNTPNVENLDFQNKENNDIAVMQWQANVMHLKSQLALSYSMVQLKDATIQALQISNYQLQQLNDGKIKQIDSDKSEDIIKGVVSVKKYEGKGFSINLPEILRRLKRNFK